MLRSSDGAGLLGDLVSCKWHSGLFIIIFSQDPVFLFILCPQFFIYFNSPGHNDLLAFPLFCVHRAQNRFRRFKRIGASIS
jgi:hypothetical protein